MNARPLRVWLVDDDASIRWVLERALKNGGMAPKAFDAAEPALDALRSDVPDVLLTDIRMPGQSGLEMLRKIHVSRPQLPVIVMLTFATLFIAQLYGIELSTGQQIIMLLTLMVTSKGMAAVPRASLVVISGTMAQFGIPEAGLVLILAVDQFLDMGRSGTNVVGNAVAAVVVAKWEGDLDSPEPPEIEPPHAPTSHVH